MEIIYQNFDTLEISFQCAVPPFILKQLQQAKAEAHALNAPVYAEIGWEADFPVMVHETGARGGYTYRLSTGSDGQIWLIGDRESPTQWNVRVKVRSLCLALYGYETTKQRLIDILNNVLRARGPDENFRQPKERISRVDYCIDFAISEPFRPELKNFVCNGGRTKKGKIGQILYFEGVAGESVETVTIGKMPNKQVTIYNKIREITAKHTRYWWELWGLKKEEFEGEIWRVEVRAGKKELNKWNLRTFENFEKIIGNVITTILKEYRYTIPNIKDTNRNRWPTAEIWKKAINSVKEKLFNYYSKTNSKIVLKQIKEDILNNYEKLIKGIFVGYTAAIGRDISEIPGVLDHVCGQLLDEIAENPQKAIQKHERKCKEFSFLNDKKSKN